MSSEREVVKRAESNSVFLLLAVSDHDHKALDTCVWQALRRALFAWHVFNLLFHNQSRSSTAGFICVACSVSLAFNWDSSCLWSQEVGSQAISVWLAFHVQNGSSWEPGRELAKFPIASVSFECCMPTSCMMPERAFSSPLNLGSNWSLSDLKEIGHAWKVSTNSLLPCLPAGLVTTQWKCSQELKDTLGCSSYCIETISSFINLFEMLWALQGWWDSTNLSRFLAKPAALCGLWSCVGRRNLVQHLRKEEGTHESWWKLVSWWPFVAKFVDRLRAIDCGCCRFL